MSSNLVVIFGPPAVGKAAIGQELSKITGYKFFHNHLTADPVVAVLGYTDGKYRQIADEFRLKIFKAGIEAKVPGVVFTLGWDLDSERDLEFVEEAKKLFVDSGGDAYFVELSAAVATREERVDTPFRLQHKPSDTHVDSRKAYIRSLEGRHRMNSRGELPISGPHIKIDTEANTEISAAQFAQREFALGNNT